MPNAAELKEIKAFVTKNASGLESLVASEVVKEGNADPQLVSQVTKFLRAHNDNKDIKSLIKQNSRALQKLLDREVSKGGSDTVLAASVTNFLHVNRRKWWWPF